MNVCVSHQATPLSPQPTHPTQPFIDPSVGLQAYFPPRVYAIAIPTVLLVLGVGLVGLFIGLTMLKAASAEKRKKQHAAAATTTTTQKKSKKA